MIIFTDIDDTLMKTARKMNGDLSAFTVGALNHQGQPLSYIDNKREQLIEKLLKKHITVPVSARSKKSFFNLQINFQHEAVLNFGGTILNKDKSLHLEWHEHILKQSTILSQATIFDDILQIMQPIYPNIEYKKVVEDGISMYLNCRDYEKSSITINDMKSMLVNFLKERKLEDKFYFYQTDRDLAIIPLFIKKETAVQFLIENVYPPNELLIGLGDHPNDLLFMKICDFVLIPTDTSLMKLLTKE